MMNPTGLSSNFMISKELSFMNSEDTLNTFELEDDDILDHQIKAISAVEGYAFVDDWNGDLSLKAQTCAGATHDTDILHRLIPIIQGLTPCELPLQHQ